MPLACTGDSMWFLGMILGAAVLGAFGGFTGGAVGAVLGALLLPRLSRDREALRALSARVDALEGQLRELARRASPEPVPGAPAVAGAQAPATVAPPLTPAELFERTAHGETVAAANVGPDALVSEARPPADARAAGGDAGTPAGPDADALAARAWQWLTGGNVVVRAGALILFVGLAFLLRLAYDVIPPAARLGGVALGGAALLALGWRLREARPGYAVTLQGAGIATLYLTVYGALRLFDMVEPAAAFVLMALVAAAGALLAVRQESVALAVLGFGGGFLAPLLASTGQGDHVVLFGYYALVNAGLATVAWNRAWRPLTFTGFVLTFGVAALWGWRWFQPALFASTQPFLMLFFAVYLALQLRFAQLRAPRWKDVVDGTSVFGVPLAGFALQVGLVRDFAYGSATSAAALGALYLLLSSRLRRRAADCGMLADAYVALGAGFLTVAIPLAVDARWTSAAWAIEGAGLAWAALRQRQRIALALGLGLQFVAALVFAEAELVREWSVPVLNRPFLGATALAAAALISAWCLDREARDEAPMAPRWLGSAVFAWGLCWWLFAGVREIGLHVPDPQAAATWLLFSTFSAAAFHAVHERLDWHLARIPALALPLAMLAALLARWFDGTGLPPMAGVGALAWPAAFATHLALMARQHRLAPAAQQALHGCVPWLLAFVLGWELDLRLQGWLGDTDWSVIGWALPGAVLLAVVTAWPATRDDGSGTDASSSAPSGEQAAAMAWLILGGVGLCAGLVAWTLFAGATVAGNSPPLPWMPVFNPLDLAVLGLPLLMLPWLRRVLREHPAATVSRHAAAAWWILAATMFASLNGVLLRDFDRVLDLGGDTRALLGASEVQAGLSLMWTTVALGTMFGASRHARRAPWFAGAALMGVVVAKLLVLDLDNAGTIARIVSFVGVGGLMLVIGWVSPLPPREDGRAAPSWRGGA